MFPARLRALMMKEFLALFADKRARIVLIAPPLLQLLLFSFAATLEVKNISLVIYNEDHGARSHDLIQRFAGAPSFTHLRFVRALPDFKAAITNQEALAGLHLGPDFSRRLLSGQAADVQIILDGRRANAAQIAFGYMNRLIAQFNAAQDSSATAPQIQVRHWYNANLLYRWFTVPSLVATLTMLISLMLTAMSVARERETGTFDQLLVSPLKPVEILLGKAAPAVGLAMAEGLMITLLGLLIFHVPFRGSFFYLILVLFIFILSCVGVGLFISSLSYSQQQAIIGTFLFMVPAITLSGYAAPIENMPLWLQHVTAIDPMRYALIGVRGLFLKAIAFRDVWAVLWPLSLISLGSLALAGWFFSKRLG